MENLLGGPPPILLPDDPASADIELGTGPDAVVRRHPASPLAWAVLSDEAWTDGRVMESYAFARVGYHRGLDVLRRNGWKGYGPVPWSHDANRGFLRCLRALRRAAAAIGEDAEVQRLADLLIECDPTIPQD